MVILSLLYDLKQSQFEFVLALFPYSQIGKDEKGSIGIIDIFEVIEGRNGCTGQEASLAIIDQVKFVLALVSPHQTCKEEVVGV